PIPPALPTSAPCSDPPPRIAQALPAGGTHRFPRASRAPRMQCFAPHSRHVPSGNKETKMHIRQWMLICAAAVLAAGCGQANDGGRAAEPGGAETTAAPPAEKSGPEAAGGEAASTPTEIVPGLTMRVLEQGSGTTAEAGDTAVVHYTGWLYDEAAANHRGAKFDSSVDRN